MATDFPTEFDIKGLERWPWRMLRFDVTWNYWRAGFVLPPGDLVVLWQVEFGPCRLAYFRSYAEVKEKQRSWYRVDKLREY